MHAHKKHLNDKQFNRVHLQHNPIEYSFKAVQVILVREKKKKQKFKLKQRYRQNQQFYGLFEY